MKKLYKHLLSFCLILLYGKKLYIAKHTQTRININLMIKLGDKFVMLYNPENDLYHYPTLDIDLEAKSNMVLSIKNMIREEISSQLSSNARIDIYLMDSFREIADLKQEKHLFSDEIYIKLDLTEFISQEKLHKKLHLLSIQELKLLQFKNKLNIYDYKMALTSNKQAGVYIG